MRRVSLIICCALSAALAACGAKQTLVLDSDVPNVLGMEPIVTRNITREGEDLVAVEVLYRGEINDIREETAAVTAAFREYGWTAASEQARGQTRLLNFTKGRRWAEVQLAICQIDPMMSSGVLEVGVGPREHGGRSAPSPDRLIGAPEGFAPPPLR
jgi:hypothetical protein